MPHPLLVQYFYPPRYYGFVRLGGLAKYLRHFGKDVFTRIYPAGPTTIEYRNGIPERPSTSGSPGWEWIPSEQGRD